MSSTRHPLRSRLVGLLACLPLLLPATSLAQSDADAGADGGLPIDLPDASAGEGGADRDNEEGEDGTGRVHTVCRSTRDCSPRFTCQDGTCRYTGVREAKTTGCLLGPEAALLLVGLAAVAAPRRKKR
ncbi:MXAN_6627.5 family MYXO-CTERM protein [Myxococcus sp. RHSTA-1-4]|uniref:MXAN_6627.5 family MYXO-CTERM protein n=1 Tax=Myxococcus sp. RHSTA-1-4 TaxID=2874601 RepID=UPI001CBDCF82|nr:MXAN_6627.5 family MYXO-CTERM protein [Myxococcus sp. RHSTA-1-4]MBZ4416115.1 hypothetical protein [Myxococcus sp. RHSTA-1-4]